MVSYNYEASDTMISRVTSPSYLKLYFFTGYYRVNYDENNWRLLIAYLNKSADYKNIHKLNRAQLINDALAFVQKDVLSSDILFGLTDYLTNEDDYIAWYPGHKTLQWIKQKLLNTEYEEHFKVLY